MKKKIYMAPCTLVVEICETEMLCVSGKIEGNLEELEDTDMDMDSASDILLKAPNIWEDEEEW